jgi:hypothetical protein
MNLWNRITNWYRGVKHSGYQHIGDIEQDDGELLLVNDDQRTLAAAWGTEKIELTAEQQATIDRLKEQVATITSRRMVESLLAPRNG